MIEMDTLCLVTKVYEMHLNTRKKKKGAEKFSLKY